MLVAFDFTNFAQISVAGIALGCLYALISLGFVIVIKSSGVLNLYQGGFSLIAAYLTYQFHVKWSSTFVVAVVVAASAMAVLGVVIERAIVRRVTGTAEGHAVLLVTIGLLLATESLVAATWGYDVLNLNDPWGLEKITIGAVVISMRDIWVIGLTIVILGAFFVLFKYSRVGIAMRAAASDREAAYAQGISPNIVLGASWAIAGVLGALTGVALGTAVAGGLNVTIDLVAFAALPAVIFGGMKSPAGAVIGGVVIGAAQLYAAAYAPISWGEGFSTVMPYIVMFVVLLIRPHGLLGKQEVRRA